MDTAADQASVLETLTALVLLGLVLAVGYVLVEVVRFLVGCLQDRRMERLQVAMGWRIACRERARLDGEVAELVFDPDRRDSPSSSMGPT